MDRIVTRTGKTKVTAGMFAEAVGMEQSNLVRLRSAENNFVTLAACHRLCKFYGTDPNWLLMGEEEGEPEGTQGLIMKLEDITSRLKHAIKANGKPVKKSVNKNVNINTEKIIKTKTIQNRKPH